MLYREAQPSPLLAPWVECYWTRTGPATGIDHVLPDGCADVIFDLSGSPGDLSEAFAVGTMTKPLIVPPSPAPELFGIRFRPGRSRLGVHVPLSELTDRRVPLRDVRALGAGLTERLTTVTTFEARVAIIEETLASSLASAEADAMIDAAIAAINRSHGSASVDSVAEALGVSRQHLARRFASTVGVSPKMFARVIRFRRVLRSAREPGVDWADLAVRAGYFDQSHLIADFRQFAGTSPVPFFQSRAAATA